MNYERIVRKIRQKIFDYPPELDAKASRVLTRAISLYVKQERAKETPEQRQKRETRAILRNNTWLTASELNGSWF